MKVEQLYTKCLAEATYFIASNGEEALELFKINKIDLIISDIKMPKMDGLTFLKKLRELHNDIPFIFLTARQEANTIIDAIQFDISNYIIWSSDIDGNIGYGTSTVAELTPGTHKVTAVAQVPHLRPYIDGFVRSDDPTILKYDSELYFMQAISELVSYNYQAAADGFAYVISEFPSEDQAANAQYWEGMANLFYDY